MATQEGGEPVAVCAVQRQLRRRPDRRQESLCRPGHCGPALAAQERPRFPAPTPSTGAGWCPRLSTTLPPMDDWCGKAKVELGREGGLLRARPGTLATSWPAIMPNGWACLWDGWSALPTRIMYSPISSPPAAYDRPAGVLTRPTSPSMDILISSNLERMLYHLAGQRRGGAPLRMDQPGRDRPLHH